MGTPTTKRLLGDRLDCYGILFLNKKYPVSPCITESVAAPLPVAVESVDRFAQVHAREEHRAILRDIIRHVALESSRLASIPKVIFSIL